MFNVVQNSLPFRRWRLFATAGLLLLLAGCSLSFQSKEERLKALQQHLAAGDAAWQGRNYAGAGEAYEAARLLAPADAALSLRLGVVYEFLGSYDTAAAVYRKALKAKGLPAQSQNDIIFRLALLEAFRLDGKGELPALLAALPPTSPYAADLQAVLALLAGDGRKALAELNLARSLPLTQEMSSIVLYHAARAYYLIGDVDRAMQNLYEAINRAGYTPISKDISEFRDFIRTQPRP